MNTTDVPSFKKLGFDSDKYLSLQQEEIIKRINYVQEGRLYLEIGGKLFHDPHAARVLPGFRSDMKVDLLKHISTPFDLLFCINYRDILSNRQLTNRSTDYVKGSLSIAQNLKESFGVNPLIVINKIQDPNNEELIAAIQEMQEQGYSVYKRYYIEGYPENSNKILSMEGYGKDDYIPVTNRLVIVTGSASNSGKMSTCLGQIYHESQNGISSGYAKYETFPIWNLPLEHPVNLAYEAATADINDRNVLDLYHQDAYGEVAVNYNRDVDAFKILKALTKDILKEDNLIQLYKSPTDMGINKAGFAITNDEVICIASYLEIQRRKQWYQELVDQGVGNSSWVKTCEGLEKEALEYMFKKKYDLELGIL